MFAFYETKYTSVVEYGDKGYSAIEFLGHINLNGQRQKSRKFICNVSPTEPQTDNHHNFFY